MTERLRFSPAPTGPLRIDGARIALFDWLVARRDGGTFILRLEDTDRTCAAPDAEASLLEDLHWLGLHWDEGPGVGGTHAPYRQSERGDHYRRSLLALRAVGAVYPCFCPPDILGVEGQEDVTAPESGYRDTCRSLPEEEVRRRMDAGEEAAWRFAVPAGRELQWSDRVHGRLTFSSDEVDDFVVVSGDGRALYDLACVSDDSSMRVTLVLRGDDHIPSTPRQLLLYDALGLRAPAFGHLPLVTGTEGDALSSSASDYSIRGLREEGYLADAIVDHLARLGWSDPLDRPALSREELLAAFDLARVSATRPSRDPQQLRSLNARHLRALPTDDLVAVIEPYVPPLPDWLDLTAFAEAVRFDLDVASDAYVHAVGLIAPDADDDEALAALREPEAPVAIQAALDAVSQADPFDGAAVVRSLEVRLAGIDPHRALPAVRTALTGRPRGLPVPTLFALLGRDASSLRLSRAHARGTIDTVDDGNG